MELSLPVQERFRQFIRPEIKLLLTQLNYDTEFDINRVTVWADTDQFKWKEDEYVWSQKRGRMGNVYSVYIDGIFICHIGDNRRKKDTLKDFWQGFLKAYSLDDNDPGKLWIDKSIYDKKLQEKKAKRQKQDEQILKAIEAKPVKSEDEAIAKEIALDVAKETRTAAK